MVMSSSGNDVANVSSKALMFMIENLLHLKNSTASEVSTAPNVVSCCMQQSTRTLKTGQPGDNLTRQCGDNLTGQCGENLKGQYGDNLRGQCGDNLKGHCGDNLIGQHGDIKANSTKEIKQRENPSSESGIKKRHRSSSDEDETRIHGKGLLMLILARLVRQHHFNNVLNHIYHFICLFYLLMVDVLFYVLICTWTIISLFYLAQIISRKRKNRELVSATSK